MPEDLRPDVTLQQYAALRFGVKREQITRVDSGHHLGVRCHDVLVRITDDDLKRIVSDPHPPLPPRGPVTPTPVA